MVLEISPMVVEQKEVVMVVLMMGVVKMKVVVEDVEMEMEVVKDFGSGQSFNLFNLFQRVMSSPGGLGDFL